MASIRLLALPLTLVALVVVPAVAELPYNPTRVFLSKASNHLAYVFQPGPATNPQPELLSLDLSQTLNTTSLPYKTLYPSLPFVNSNASIAFTPVEDSNGNITVYSGDCSNGAAGSQLWRFTPDPQGNHGSGSWIQKSVYPYNLGGDSGLAGSNYLSSGLAFSSSAEGNSSDTSIYMFGGMCPTATATQDTWTSAANYSNLMLTLKPKATPGASAEFELDLTSGRGPPVAEAGFTITALEPTFSNASDGTRNQQRDFVLLGGHTRTAFINMSQLALLSLPQQSWTFLPMLQPFEAKSDLAARAAATTIEPRSGHSAALTPDGSRIILFGGWVGDINTPANPQLAVLHLGQGYGGRGDWTWTVLTTTGPGLSAGAGIYGHGAVMMPDGVMMIVGGYSIAALASRSRKRATQPGNSGAYFYNTTSNAWLSSYTPILSPAQTSQQSSLGPLTTTSQKAGLGAGLAVLILIIIAIIVFYFWYIRRLNRLRSAREKELRELSLTACMFPSEELGRKRTIGGHSDMTAIDREYHRQNTVKDSYAWPAGTEKSGNFANMREAERTGLLVEIPSPTRGLRKGMHPRGNYQLAPRYDEQRVAKGSGDIHPIDEREEEDGDSRSSLTDAERQLRKIERVLSSQASIDPFQDPDPLGSHPVSPEPGDTVRRIITNGSRGPIPHFSMPLKDRQGDLTNWVSHWHDGRLSPSKSDDRGSSSHSELSTRSDVSTTFGGLARSISTRSAALFGSATTTNAFVTPNPSPTHERKGAFPPASGPKPLFYYGRPGSSTAESVPPRSRSGRGEEDAESFATAATSFTLLQSEGEALLGGRPDTGTSGHLHRQYSRTTARHPASASGSRTVTPTPNDLNNISAVDFAAAPGGTGAPTPKRRLGWMGSVRRVLTSVAGSGSERSASMTVATPRYDYGGSSSSSSPTKDQSAHAGAGAGGRAQAGVVRRAASDGAYLWRNKRGARDWDADADMDVHLRGGFERYRDESPARDDRGNEKRRGSAGKGRDGGDEDWDVEAAVEKRMVQVMFTVPKTRLRVVNEDMERASLMSGDAESVKDGKDEGGRTPSGGRAGEEEHGDKTKGNEKRDAQDKEKRRDDGADEAAMPEMEEKGIWRIE
ncbi:hypothetical protein BJ546DRAFT_840164 [Cryomyces antarcticus]